LPRRELVLFRPRGCEVVRIAEDEPTETRALAGRVDAGLDRAQSRERPRGVLVAQRHEHGDIGRERCRNVAGGGEWRN
jgi:hypothetical protein